MDADEIKAVIQTVLSELGIESNSMLFNTSLLGIDGVTDALEAIYRKWESRG
jgi:hypothetical protein